MVIAAGACAFHYVADHSWNVALFRSFMTASSGGNLSEPSSDSERTVMALLVLFGAGLYLFGASLVFEAIGKRIVSVNWRERRERARVERLTDHQIICGYGRVGQAAAAQLRQAQLPYVVVELDERNLALAREQGELAVAGDATRPEVLEAAGLARAAGLIAVMDTDAENLYAVVLAHGHNPDLQVAARASTADAARKLGAAGADRIVSPYEAAGKKLAAMAANPNLENFIDLSGYANADLQLAQVEAEPSSWADGRALGELIEDTGARPVALWHGTAAGAELELAPERRLQAGDVLIAIGSRAAITALERRLKS